MPTPRGRKFQGVLAREERELQLARRSMVRCVRTRTSWGRYWKGPTRRAGERRGAKIAQRAIKPGEKVSEEPPKFRFDQEDDLIIGSGRAEVWEYWHMFARGWARGGWHRLVASPSTPASRKRRQTRRRFARRRGSLL